MMSELPRRHGRRCGGGGKSKKLRAEQILSSSVCNGQPHHVQELGSVSKSSRQPNSTILPPRAPFFLPYLSVAGMALPFAKWQWNR